MIRKHTIIQILLDNPCVERHASRPCDQMKDRESCLTSRESRSVVHFGKDIFGTDCVWCPNGPCTGNNRVRCEPKTWMEGQGLTNFESCLQSTISYRNFDEACAERGSSIPCDQIKDRVSCLTSRESRSGVHFGKDIFGTDCVWCPNGPCTRNNRVRCEPKSWMEGQGLTNFESCLQGKNNIINSKISFTN